MEDSTTDPAARPARRAAPKQTPQAEGTPAAKNADDTPKPRRAAPATKAAAPTTTARTTSGGTTTARTTAGSTSTPKPRPAPAKKAAAQRAPAEKTAAARPESEPAESEPQPMLTIEVEPAPPTEPLQPMSGSGAEPVEPADWAAEQDPPVALRAADPRSAPFWATLIQDPRNAPEHLAHEAVRRLGPAAGAWADTMRTRYPAASVDALARLATLEAIRARRSQASLVLTVAAVYGRDPASPERVPELLELLQAPRLASPRTKDFAKAGRVLAALAVRRLAARVIPFGGLLAESVLSGRSLDDVARRTLAYYGSRDGKRAFTNR